MKKSLRLGWSIYSDMGWSIYSGIRWSICSGFDGHFIPVSGGQFVRFFQQNAKILIFQVNTDHSKQCEQLSECRTFWQIFRQRKLATAAKFPCKFYDSNYSDEQKNKERILQITSSFLFFKLAVNGLCMWSAGLKVMNFQARTEPIRLFNILNFPSIVKDELAVLQQRAAVQICAETRITYDTLLASVVILLPVLNVFLNQLQQSF